MVTVAPMPNFLYIGTSKAGSTWLFNLLANHPDVHLAPSKGLYYFDQHFDRGRDWYLDQFGGGRPGQAIGEISHSYLSSPAAAARIAELNPRMRLLVCLREPVDRAFSDYLDLLKNRQYDGPFRTALEEFPRLLDRGRYATHLQRYLELFPREQLHIGLFDDLRTDPRGYAEEVFDFLEISRIDLPPAQLRSRMPAGRPRSAKVASAAKSASRLAKRAGLGRVRSRAKRSILLRQALYHAYTDDRPTIDPGLAADLRRSFRPEVVRLSEMLGVPLEQRWGYQESTPDTAAQR